MADTKDLPRQKRIVVEIFGKSIPLRTDNPEHLERVARYVDRQMKAMAHSVRSLDATKIAALASLQMADEYVQMKEASEALQKKMQGIVTDEKLKAANKKLQAANDGLQDVNEELRRQLAAAKEEQAKQLADADKAAQELRQKLQAYAAANERQQRLTEELRQGKKASDDKLAALRQEKKSVDAKFAALEREKKAADNKLVALQQEKAASDTKFDALQKQKKSVDDKLAVAGRARKLAEESVAALRREKKDSDAKLAALQQEKKTAVDKFNAMNREKIMTQSRLTALQREKKASDEKVRALQTEQQKLLTGMETLRRDFDTEKDNLNKQIDSLGLEQKEAERVCDRLQKENDELHEQNVRLQKDLRKAEAAVHDSPSADQTAELTRLQTEKQELDDAYRKLREAQTAASQQMQDLQSELSEEKKRYARLKNDYDEMISLLDEQTSPQK